LQTPAYGNAALRSSPGAENNFSESDAFCEAGPWDFR